MNHNTVFIGGGNMAEALLKGMLSAGQLSRESTTVTDIREDRLGQLAEAYGVHTTSDTVGAMKNADTVWLCVKPQVMDDVITPLKDVSPNALFISIAAGVPAAKIEKALGGKVRVVRVMPNTPALVGEGMAGVAAGAFASQEDVDAVMAGLRCVGKAVQVSEEDLHAVTAISGSGPAYVFYLIEHLKQAGKELGLEAELAQQLALQTVKGAAELMEQSGETADVLRERVTSKGGTTAAALEMFRERSVGEGLSSGAKAAAARSRDLAT